MRKLEITGKIHKVTFHPAAAEMLARTTFTLEEMLFENGDRRAVFHGVTVYGNRSNWLNKLSEKQLTVLVAAIRFRNASWDSESEKDLDLILEGELISVV